MRRSSASANISLRDLARLRQCAYGLFGHGWFYPDDRKRGALAAVARELISCDEDWLPFAFFPEWMGFLHALARQPQQDLDALQQCYVSSFMVNGAGLPCPICESAYAEGDHAAAGWLLAELEAEYAEVGLSPRPRLPEPPDSAVVELEYMAFLCRQEAEAWGQRHQSQALEMLQRERQFLSRHLARWFPAFARRVIAAVSESLYVTSAKAATTFIIHDGDLLDTILRRYTGFSEVAHGMSRR